MKSDLLLIVGKSSQNRNPEGFRPRTNGRTDGEFGILECFDARTPDRSAENYIAVVFGQPTSSKPPCPFRLADGPAAASRAPAAWFILISFGEGSECAPYDCSPAGTSAMTEEDDIIFEKATQQLSWIDTLKWKKSKGRNRVRCRRVPVAE
jgi:hypothetical protein